ncbi:MAG TPA: RDD family protein [Candidatus Acidoferrales bacterium]|nr:RDD family protein [Candidatus Acidoferrales bacterium]
MERRLAVRTGESIVIEYELAGLGSRFLAMFADFSIQIVVALVVSIVLLIIASVQASFVQHLGSAMTIAALSIFVFVVFFGYFIIFETMWNGMTPGKRMLGIRVVRDGGYPVDFMSAVIRNAIRPLEFALGFYTISAIVALASPQNKRLGDLAAGTIVVRG